MKKIALLGRLGKDKTVLVDDLDFEYLIPSKWYLNHKGYPVRNKTKNGERGLMHRVIMNPSMDMQVDHINGNKLDNRKENLRICTNAQNQYNTNRKKSNKASIYKGVRKSRSIIKNKIYEYWGTSIRVNYKSIWLGNYGTEIEAAQAYDQAAKKYFGEFANPNFQGGNI